MTMQEANFFKRLLAPPTTRHTLALIGFVQGFTYWVAYDFWPEGRVAEAFAASGVVLVTGWAIVLLYSWTGSEQRRIALPATVLPAIFALLSLWVWWQVPEAGALYEGDNGRVVTWIFAAVIAMYVLLPFIQIFQRDGRLSFPYSDLFRHSWNNFFVLAIGQLFVGVFWALIFMWGELFKAIGIEIFDRVFTSSSFVAMSLTTMFAYGVAIGRENERITNMLRRITVMVFRSLMPLLGFIALLFLSALPFTGLQPLWDTSAASAIMLTFISLSVLFLNAVFQDGKGDPPYPIWLRKGVQAALVVMPVYVLLTFWALGMRINQYGLTQPRFFGLLVTAVLGLYTFGYAYAVFRSKVAWMSMVRTVNLRMALVVVALAWLTHTPILDAQRWSARNQFNRLASGAVDAESFDFGLLRFELGHVGYAKLIELEELTDHPQAELIQEQIARVRDASSARELSTVSNMLAREDIVDHDSNAPMPDDLWTTLQRGVPRWVANTCKEQPCIVMKVNLDDDDLEEYVLVHGQRGMFAYDRSDDGSWFRVGSLQRIGQVQRDEPELREMLRTELVETIPSRYRVLRIGDRSFQLMVDSLVSSQ